MFRNNLGTTELRRRWRNLHFLKRRESTVLSSYFAVIASEWENGRRRRLQAEKI